MRDMAPLETTLLATQDLKCCECGMGIAIGDPIDSCTFGWTHAICPVGDHIAGTQ